MNTGAVVCDIEGTTTSLSFVHDVLFPLSHREMDEFIKQNWKAKWLLKELSAIDAKAPDEVVRLLRSWIEANKKDPVLKAIQGKIWKRSFESGEIRAHVYPDVPPNFKTWRKRGIKIAIFSSGSVEAQKLLFRYSEAGNLSRYVNYYFDTTVGGKKESGAYKKIADTINLAPVQTLFLSDVQAELDAAASIGMRTTQVLREGVVAGSHPTVETFTDLRF